MDGLEFLTEVRKTESLKHISVVILTTSKEEKDRNRAYELNVAGYMVKPVDYSNFLETMDSIFNYWSLSEFPILQVTLS